MTPCGQIRRKSTPSPDTLAIHLLRHWSIAQAAGERVTLDVLVERLGEDGVVVRRSDVRSVVSTLATQGYADALRMRLTLTGFAIGSSIRDASVRAATARAGEHDIDDCESFAA